MYTKPKRLRRSQLAVPGSDENKMAKAIAGTADHVFLDLEDAVAPSAKKDARKKIIDALKKGDWGKPFAAFASTTLKHLMPMVTSSTWSKKRVNTSIPL